MTVRGLKVCRMFVGVSLLGLTRSDHCLSVHTHVAYAIVITYEKEKTEREGESQHVYKSSKFIKKRYRCCVRSLVPVCGILFRSPKRSGALSTRFVGSYATGPVGSCASGVHERVCVLPDMRVRARVDGWVPRARAAAHFALIRAEI